MPRGAQVAKREIAGRIDGQLAVQSSAGSCGIANAREGREAVSDRHGPLSLVSSGSQPVQAPRPARASTAVVLADERRRWERDLHDGVQNELVVLIAELGLAQQDGATPPALVGMLAGLEARGQAALDAVRSIARGIYPAVLAEFGLAPALHALAARATVEVSLSGVAPRGTEAAEQAVYFACSEAIQNAAKHAGREARAALRLCHHRGSLAVRIADDGRGFDPAHTPRGAGLRNPRDRIEDLDGTFTVASTPGYGTVVTISLPWPAPVEGRR